MTISLEEARTQVKSGKADGVICPCCGLFVKEYNRKFNSGMARSLIWLVRTWESTQEGWVEVAKAPSYVTRSREWDKLEHWGMVERKPNPDDPSKKASGFWMPTSDGVDFVYLELEVSSHVRLFDGSVMGFSEQYVDIRDALGDRFDYEELMNE